MAETIFHKPLDQEVASINAHLVNHYSTIEHDSGRVYVGKTVYSKLVEVAKAANTTIGTVDLTSTGIVSLVGFDGFITAPNINLVCGLTYMQSSSHFYTVDYVTNTKLLRVLCGEGNSKTYACTAYVTIYYTKE